MRTYLTNSASCCELTAATTAAPFLSASASLEEQLQQQQLETVQYICTACTRNYSCQGALEYAGTPPTPDGILRKVVYIEIDTLE